MFTGWSEVTHVDVPGTLHWLVTCHMVRVCIMLMVRVTDYHNEYLITHTEMYTEYQCT